MEIITDNGQTTLVVCFEKNGEEYGIPFRKIHNDVDEYFYLVYDSGAAVGDEKGSLAYGEKKYKIKFTGDKPPFLLVNLARNDVERPQPRVVEGRSVSSQ